MSVSLTKDFLTKITPYGYPPFMYKVTLVTEFKQNDKGSFYVVKYRLDGNLAQDLLTELGLNMNEVHTGFTVDASGNKVYNYTEKGKVFKARMDQIWAKYEDNIKAYEKIFKETIELDTQDSEIVAVETQTEGALF
jgi:hypothetical protein